MSMKNLKIFALSLLSLTMASCHLNDFKEFSDYYIAFDPGSSSSTVINEAGSVVGQYMILHGQTGRHRFGGSRGRGRRRADGRG